MCHWWCWYYSEILGPYWIILHSPSPCLCTRVGLTFSLIYIFKYHTNSNRLPQTLLFFEIVPCLTGEYGCRSRAELRTFKHPTSSPKELSTVSRPQNENRAKRECLILFFSHWAAGNEIVWMCFHHIYHIILDVVTSLSLSLYLKENNIRINYMLFLWRKKGTNGLA